jgi:hypothetical protein
MSFVELRTWLDNIIAQTDGVPSAICETGEPYLSFRHYALARPEDVSVIEKVVADAMQESLATYMKDRHGTLYWRTRLETSINDRTIIEKFDDVKGPDKDFITDRKCFMDKNWKKVGAFCRLYKAPFRTIGL